MGKPTGGLKWTGTRGDDTVQPSSIDTLAKTSYDGGAGYDTLDLSLLSSGVSLELAGTTKGGAASSLWPGESFSGSWWSYIFDLNGTARIDGSIRGFEKILGTANNDYLKIGGGTIDRYVDGGAGDDAIQVTGASGTSTAVGGLGADQLFGSYSGDILIGGTFDGIDATGDSTSDEFVMYAGTILDFEVGTDRLFIDDASGAASAAPWVDATTAHGAAAQLTITADRVITLVGVTAAEMNGVDKGFVLLANGEITSTSGDDLIFDTTAYDTDRLIFPNGSGHDLVVGFDAPLDSLVFGSDVVWSDTSYHGEEALVGTYDGGQSSITLVGLSTADVGSLIIG